MTPQERAAIVFDIVVDGFTATDGDVVVAAAQAELRGQAVVVTLTATRAGQQIALANPYVFVNPPLGVLDGDEIIVDPFEAVRQMLIAVVR